MTKQGLLVTERFLLHVDFDGPVSEYNPELGSCYLWTGAVNPAGYGRFRIKDKTVQAHNFAYGVIPEGRELDHLCRVHACVRRDHLEAVPHKINLLRGISPAAYHAQAQHCPQNHPYAGSNLYVRPDGKGRGCRRCRNIESVA